MTENSTSSHDGTFAQVDALRALLREVGSSNFTVAPVLGGTWWVVAYADDGDAPACRAFITPRGRVRTEATVSA